MIGMQAERDIVRICRQTAIRAGTPPKRVAQRRRAARCCAVFGALVVAPGCTQAFRPLFTDSATTPTTALADPAEAATVFGADQDGRSAGRALRPPQYDVVLDILHVQTPREQFAETAPIWRRLREDAFSSEAALRLRRNGMRVGVGTRDAWAAIQSTLAAIAGVRSQQQEPMRLPAGFPIALEVDENPADQTIFTVGGDGVLSGETWNQSQVVLRVTQRPLGGEPPRVRLALVPEVRRRSDKLKWIRTEEGPTQVPDYDGRAYAGAAVTVDLTDEEFVVLAPSEAARVYGILGGVLLSRVEEDARFDSLIFLRPGIRHGTDRQP